MNPTTVAKLLTINRVFYDELAQPFADSRDAGQPSLQRVVQYVRAARSWLDVGCGNGRLALALEEAGLAVRYTGVDASERLLAIAARSATTLSAVQADFKSIDISVIDWTRQLAHDRFDAIALLAVLHHVPGRDRRVEALSALRGLLTADGVIAVSAWQFLNEERLRRKIVPWPAVGLDASDLEPGDYLLDWRRGGTGFRYCHLIDEAELNALAAAAGLSVAHRFYADGVGQNLNLVAFLRPASADLQGLT